MRQAIVRSIDHGRSTHPFPVAGFQPRLLGISEFASQLDFFQTGGDNRFLSRIAYSAAGNGKTLGSTRLIDCLWRAPGIASMDRGRQVLELFDQAFDLSADQLDSFLTSACGENRELRQEVEALLAAREDAKGLFKVPTSRSTLQGITNPCGGQSGNYLAEGGHHGRFLPGMVVGRRYRIVSRVGQGGMGEVYRADDLKLGHSVAIKFLPEAFENDLQRLELFHNEVRLARQISHPNVCRVYDIGAVDHQHFLSMEYVDGEDLDTLLRRIGRLPPDKGVEIAHQLCAGIAAAHDRGVIHRDLKPANVMIDGRGHVRITDFGLARVVSDDAIEEVAGTPTYMAPEQLLSGKTSIQSDLYSLGLILHELFTGEPVYTANSLPELKRQYAESKVLHPSSHVSDLYPEIDNTIRRCLEYLPEKRPKSVRAVAASLPGGDPIAAALAVGDTPLPEVVAAAGGHGTISKKLGVAMFAGVILGLALCWTISARSLINRAGLRAHPQVLANQTLRVVRAFGYEQPPTDATWAYRFNPDRWRVRSQSNSRDLNIEFWYRQSQTSMTPHLFYSAGRRNLGNVTYDNPPFTEPDMIRVDLDTDGHLLGFLAIPPRHDPGVDVKDGKPFPWEEFFNEDARGLFSFSATTLTESVPTWTPPVAFDSQAAWLGENSDGRLVRIEVACFRGRPVHFQVTSNDTRSSSSRRIPLLPIVAMSLVFIAGWGTYRNFHSGRGDRAGARRIATFMFVSNILLFMLIGSHSLRAEVELAQKAMAWGLLAAFETWLFYMAFEPLIRRTLPRNLISWNRVLAGQLQDSFVGYDALVGVLFAVCLKLIKGASEYVVDSSGLAVTLPFFLPSLWPFIDSGHAAARLIAEAMNAIRISWWYLLTFCVSHFVVRDRRAAMAVTTILWGMIWMTSGGGTVAFAFIFIAFAKLMLLLRFGLWTLCVAIFVERVLEWPITTDTNSWYFSIGFSAILIVMAVATYALRNAVGVYRVALRHHPLR